MRSLIPLHILVVTTALSCAAATSGASADGGCERYSPLDPNALADYQFNEPIKLLDEIPADTRLTVGDISVVRQQVFNTDLEDEDQWLFQLANRLHLGTRESAIRQALLFTPDEPISQRKLAEAERALRRKPFLFDARVIPRQRCDDALDVDVVVRDVWTLNPRAWLIRSGGENSYGIGISDTNALGTGKTFSLGYERDLDRRGTTLMYMDPNIAGGRVSLDLLGVNSDDGSQLAFDLRRPFYALDTPYSLGMTFNRHRRVEGHYLLGDRSAEFFADTRHVSVSGGLGGAVHGTRVNRILFGFDSESHEFRRVDVADVADDVVGPPALFPDDRKRVYPWLGFERVDADYETVVNVDRIHRTEDLFVGSRLAGRLGFSAPVLGGDDRRLVYRLSASNAERLGDVDAGTDSTVSPHRHLIAYGANLDGEWALGAGRIEDLRLSGYMNYRFNHAERLSFFASATANFTRRMAADRQLLLGGDTGLRGYPNRFQSGDRSFLLTLEERYYSNIYPGRLFRLGGAVFVDVGRAWHGASDGPEDPGVLSNVGIGLRLESTRTRRDRIVHLDFAVPLRDGENVRGAEITLTAKEHL